MGRLEGKVALAYRRQPWHRSGDRAALTSRRAHRVVIADIDEPGPSATAAESQSAALAVRCGRVVARQVEHAFDVCIERFGTIDVLVNNAGITFAAVRHFLETDGEAFWDFVQGTNLKGHFLCAHRAARGEWLSAGSGDHQHVERARSRAHGWMLAYDAAKGGIEAMTRALALDLGPYGIRAVRRASLPGMMVESRETSDPDRIASVDATVPLGLPALPPTWQARSVSWRPMMPRTSLARTWGRRRPVPAGAATRRSASTRTRRSDGSSTVCRAGFKPAVSGAPGSSCGLGSVLVPRVDPRPPATRIPLISAPVLRSRPGERAPGLRRDAGWLLFRRSGLCCEPADAPARSRRPSHDALIMNPSRAPAGRCGGSSEEQCSPTSASWASTGSSPSERR